jgi:hypothetical protein
MGHLFCGNWNGLQPYQGLHQAQQTITAPIVNPMQGAASRSNRKKLWEIVAPKRSSTVTE